ADLDPDERDIVAVVHDWVRDSVRPVARDLEHANTYPAELIEAMKRFGVFGLVIPESYGGAGVSTACFALVTEELARGWMSLAGAGPGFSGSRDRPKLGYKGVETCELVFDGYRCPAEALLGGTEGAGFAQMMDGLELGRIQVAARAVGVARAALEDSLRYAQEREKFGQTIWRHQAVVQRLAVMDTRLVDGSGASKCDTAVLVYWR